MLWSSSSSFSSSSSSSCVVFLVVLRFLRFGVGLAPVWPCDAPGLLALGWRWGGAFAQQRGEAPEGQRNRFWRNGVFELPRFCAYIFILVASFFSHFFTIKT